MAKKHDFGSKQGFSFQKKKNQKQKKKAKGNAPEVKKTDKSQVVCYTYGKKGHYSRECNQSQQAPSQQSPSQKSPRVQCYYCKGYGHTTHTCPSLEKKKSPAKLNVIEASQSSPKKVDKGKKVLKVLIYFHDIPVRVLFDTGASHSFVSKELVDRFDLDCVCLVTSLRVVNPIGGYATLGLLCRDVSIVLDGYTFLCDLHVFDYLGFGFILGMDWLS